MVNGPNCGMKDVVRRPDQWHIWWIDSLWLEFCPVTWEYAVDVEVTRHPSIGSSLRGWPHTVGMINAYYVDVDQGNRSWL
jgi:hypothetical protein